MVNTTRGTFITFLACDCKRNDDQTQTCSHLVSFVLCCNKEAKVLHPVLEAGVQGAGLVRKDLLGASAVENRSSTADGSMNCIQ